MPKKHLDFLQECMSGFAMPIDAFNNAWCRVCSNQECSRSVGGSGFNKRVNEWEEKLFLNVSRAEENDPKFANIRAKNFVPVNADPLLIYSRPEPSQAEIIRSNPNPVEIFEKPEIIPPAPPANIVKKEPPAPPAPIIEPPQVEPQKVTGLPLNTPFEQGMTLKQTKDVIIQPGGTFVFGDDDD